MTSIFCAMDHVLLLADYNDPRKHRHLAKHLFISLDGKVTYCIEDNEFICEGVIVDSNVFHTIKSNESRILVYLFDETTDVAEEMKHKYLHNNTYHVLEEIIVEKIKETWNRNMNSTNNYDNIKKYYLSTYKEILGICELNSNILPIKDKRINKVLNLLKFMEEIKEDTIDKLASEVHLSKSRLSHLFKQETKISLGSWLVIMKISKTYEYILSGETITCAAIKAGFYSSSHFATTNMELFGISASQIKKDVEVINI